MFLLKNLKKQSTLGDRKLGSGILSANYSQVTLNQPLTYFYRRGNQSRSENLSRFGSECPYHEYVWEHSHRAPSTSMKLWDSKVVPPGFGALVPCKPAQCSSSSPKCMYYGNQTVTRFLIHRNYKIMFIVLSHYDWDNLLHSNEN